MPDVRRDGIVPGHLVPEEGGEVVPVVWPADVGQVEEHLPIRPEEVKDLPKTAQVGVRALENSRMPVVMKQILMVRG